MVPVGPRVSAARQGEGSDRLCSNLAFDLDCNSGNPLALGGRVYEVLPGKASGKSSSCATYLPPTCVRWPNLQPPDQRTSFASDESIPPSRTVYSNAVVCSFTVYVE